MFCVCWTGLCSFVLSSIFGLVSLVAVITLFLKSVKLDKNRQVNDLKGVVNCQNSRDKGPPEGNSARG